jgi:hypothetical protein
MVMLYLFLLRGKGDNFYPVNKECPQFIPEIPAQNKEAGDEKYIADDIIYKAI